MKTKEIREMKPEEIRQRLQEERDQHRQLAFQHAIAQVENPMVLREKRRLIARLETILHQKEQAA